MQPSFCTLVLAALLGAWPVSPSRAKPTNVLFIAIDDLRPELGCYGGSHVESPHIDELARRGIVFHNHFVPVPTCGASRYGLLTGRSPRHTGVTRGNRAFVQPTTRIPSLPGDRAYSLPELFRRNGYYTTCIGKISHTPDGRNYAYDGTGDGRYEVPHAWDELATPFGPWKRGWGIFFAYADGHHREDGYGHRDLMEFVAENDNDLPDGLLAEAAVAKLAERANDDRPFFLSVGFFKPHLPFVATRADWEAVADWPVPPPPRPARIASHYWHASNEFYGYHAPWEKSRPLAPAATDQSRRAYLACVRYVDRQVGKVLDALSTYDLVDSTIVVLWGDHGWNLGDGAMWAKHVAFERALRSPLLLSGPGIQHGISTNALVQTLDIYPTLVELCDLEVTDTAYRLDGTSLAPLLDRPNRSVHNHVFGWWGNTITVRDETFRLVATRRAQGELEHIELYDVTTTRDMASNIADERSNDRDRLVGVALDSL